MAYFNSNSNHNKPHIWKGKKRKKQQKAEEVIKQTHLHMLNLL